MPRFEDDTLEGAIKKATLGLRKPKLGSFGKTSGFAKRSSIAPKSRIRSQGENFADRTFGSRIGSGGANYTTIEAAIRAATNEMRDQARMSYPDRFRAIQSGGRANNLMIPELADRVLVSDWRDIGSGSERYEYDGLYVGVGYRRSGRGDFVMPPSTNIAAIVHAHWLDNRASGADRSKLRELIGYISRRRGVHRGDVRVRAFVYGIRTGVSEYS